MEKYIKLYQEAAEHIKHELDGNYDGYTGANAVSKYINDKHGINAANETVAGNALAEVMESFDWGW
ncbi:hypothetical protein L1077_27020 [Pseudoalteromonas luteoviolacea]|uniref:hypothetical protein n=1 Tax=Pseudoalteromonas luteoviolacea TaxID=43657 RepID=UPI001F226D81|nr:hypothetical protein [Pseudoalteromonas luteoviolacea]MCF6443083.1 hypothetical protein [Pseudoalteromonas luteoviolacea]